MKKKTNLEVHFQEGTKPEIGYEFEYNLNQETYISKEQVINGDFLHKQLGTSATTHFIAMKTKKGKDLIGPETKIDLGICGIERFIIRPFKEKKVDVEAYYCEGTKPIITYEYVIKINSQTYCIKDEIIDRLFILNLAKADSKKNLVRMVTKEGVVILNEGDNVDVSNCGVERFIIEPLDCTEGFIVGNHFPLPTVDERILNGIEEHVVTIKEGNSLWVIIRNKSLPPGYRSEKADWAILIPPHYPRTALDMMYFYPPLQREDGKTINALSTQSIEGKSYQRWSRHRTAANPWKIGVDNIESHLALIWSCLLDEFNKR